MSLSKNNLESFRLKTENTITKNDQRGRLPHFIGVSPKIYPLRNINQIQRKTTQFSLLNNLPPTYDKHGKLKEIKFSYLDNKSNQQEYNLTPKNVLPFLKNLKDEDKQLYYQGIHTNSYDLRKLAFVMANQDDNLKLKSYHAFTYDDTFKIINKTFVPDQTIEQNWVTYLDTQAHWLPERYKLHQQIKHQALKDITKLSDQINQQRQIAGQTTPAIIMFRGNSCSGKSSVLMKNTCTNIAIGAINPDTYKNILKNDLIVDHQIVFDQYLIHHEGALIAHQLINHPDTQDKSIVIDKRHIYQKDYEEIKAMEIRKGAQKRQLEIKISDSPLELCLTRILNRDPYDLSPCVHYQALADGHRGLRDANLAIINDAQKHDWIKVEFQINHNQTDDVTIYSNDQLQSPNMMIEQQGDSLILRYINLNTLNHNQRPSTTKIDQMVLVILPLLKALNPDSQKEIKLAREILINSEYIEEFTRKYGHNQLSIRILNKYIGQKLSEAVDSKTKFNHQDSFTHYHYLQQVGPYIRTNQFNNTNMSEDNIEDKIDDTFKILWKATDIKIEKADDIFNIIQQINRSINPTEIHDNPKLRNFCQTLFRSLNNKTDNPRQMAAYIEYQLSHNNIAQHQQAKEFGRLCAFWLLMHLNHEKLPVKSMNSARDMKFREFQEAYLNQCF